MTEPKHRLERRVARWVRSGLAGLAGVLMICGPAGGATKTKNYKVREGDNLWTIARRLDTHVKDLVAANGLNPGKNLQPGQVIKVPVRSSTRNLSSKTKRGTTTRVARGPSVSGKAGSRAGTYTVRKGDSPWLIARRHGIGTQPLLRANGLSERSRLQPGTRLVLPGVNTRPVSNDRSSMSRTSRLVHKPVASSAPKTAAYAVITSPRAALHARPDPKSARVRSVTRGMRLALIGRHKSWLKLRLADGGIAWIPGYRTAIQRPAVAYLPRPAAPAFSRDPRLTDKTALAASDANGQVSTSEESQFIRMLAEQLAKDPESSEHVAETSEILLSQLPPPVPSAAGEGSLGDGAASKSAPSFARQGLAYLGTPYRRGGLSSRGMDCSGLVVRVLRDHGMDAPHRAAALFKMGTPTPKSQLQAGDLVFFQNTYRRGVSHVGIYIGDGKFVHASTRGRQVRISGLSESYYLNHWAGARRLR